MTASEHHDINRKLRILNHAKDSANVSQTCRYFGISRVTFYQWKRAYEKDGEQALIKVRVASGFQPRLGIGLCLLHSSSGPRSSPTTARGF